MLCSRATASCILVPSHLFGIIAFHHVLADWCGLVLLNLFLSIGFICVAVMTVALVWSMPLFSYWIYVNILVNRWEDDLNSKALRQPKWRILNIIYTKCKVHSAVRKKPKGESFYDLQGDELLCTAAQPAGPPSAMRVLPREQDHHIVALGVTLRCFFLCWLLYKETH